MDLSDWREDYTKNFLQESDLPKDPFALFGIWFSDASTDQNPEPNAMVLTTASEFPSSRVVLLKGIEDEQFIFYTNYESNKGNEIAKNPHVSLLFYWPMSQRQVRIQGVALKVDRAKSEAYFHSRPLGSQISAAASPQSQQISATDLLDRVAKMQGLETVPCPAHWGGYAVAPSSIEFWQGRSSRLHDRMLYKKSQGNFWEISRLAP